MTSSSQSGFPSIKLSSPETKEFWEVRVVHEDAHLLAVDKPARLLVSPDRYDPKRPNLMGLLHRDIARGAAWARERGLSYLANVHRLDFETSGVLLLAKDKPSLIELANQFGNQKPEKSYLALVHGVPPEQAFEVDAKLSQHPVKVGLMRVDGKQGKPSLTRFYLTEEFDGYTWLQCLPATGRTHQIRVHLRHAGFPIVADELYGGHPLLLSRLKRGYRLKPGRTELPLLNRVALHAASLKVLHPVTKEPVLMEAPLPKDLQVSLKYLRRYLPARSAGGLHQEENEPDTDHGGDDEQEDAGNA